jgi:hypothetical protein
MQLVLAMQLVSYQPGTGFLPTHPVWKAVGRQGVNEIKPDFDLS